MRPSCFGSLRAKLSSQRPSSLRGGLIWATETRLLLKQGQNSCCTEPPCWEQETDLDQIPQKRESAGRWPAGRNSHSAAQDLRSMTASPSTCPGRSKIAETNRDNRRGCR